MEEQPLWRFKQQDPGYPKWDPVEAEFFAEEGAPDALVREAIQNSLDAAIDDVVHVRFSFGATATGSRYVSGLSPHLSAVDVVDPADTEFAGDLDYLVIEDFGTRGLTGDPLQVRDDHIEGSAEKNNFYYFWRNIGRSRKEEADIGRWGLGKRVFPSSSRIFTFFGLTRRPDGHEYLMGQCVLKTHYRGETEYFPYGYYSGITDRGVNTPIEEDGWLADFRRVFQLIRSSETGLSVVVPRPKPNLTPAALQRATLKHYFYPIIQGRLRVDVESRRAAVTIAADTIDEVAASVDWSDEDSDAQAMHELFDFVRALPIRDDSSCLKLHPTGRDSAPYWSQETIGEETMAAIRAALDEGEIVSLIVPVHVHSRHHGSELSGFRIYLERSHDAKSKYGDLYFLRRGITIPAAGRWRRRDLRALVVVEAGALSTLLGDAENPAHTDWIASAERVKREYERGYSTINFVKHSVAKLMDLLAQSVREVDRDWLGDVFSVSAPSKSDGGSDSSRRKRRTPIPDIDPPTRPRLFRLTELQGGFAIRGTTEGEVDLATVRVAYDLADGNAFKAWSPHDFQLSDPSITIAAESCEVERVGGNRIWFKPQNSSFELRVTGFDERRDIRVDVRRVNR